MGRIVRQAWLIARNDLRQELRQFELLLTSGFFTLVVVVMFAVAFFGLDARVQRVAVPGMVWLCVAFVGSLTLSRVFDRERESDTLAALLAGPVDRLAIYFGKVLVTLGVLSVCAVILIPGAVFVFPAARAFFDHPLQTAAVMVVGSLGYAAIGVLFSAGLASKSSKNVLLSIILYPLSMPILLMALAATQRVIVGHPDVWTTIAQIAALDIAFLIVASFVFESVLVGAKMSGPSSSKPAQGSSDRVQRAMQRQP